MKLFECHGCGQPLYFENSCCESCGRRLGFIASSQEITALEPAEEGNWSALAQPGKSFRFCANAQHEACNWLIPAEDPNPYCRACRHNRTVPDLSSPQNLSRWRSLETAKRR